MIKYIVKQLIPNLTAEQVYKFMTNPSDENYCKWWEGEHLQFHIAKHGISEHRGDIVFFDEYLGKKHRLTFYARVVKADKPNIIVWQMVEFGVKLPALVTLRLQDSSQGLMLTHELRLGLGGIGKMFDPFIKLYFNNSLRNALEEHCNIEWFKLRDLFASGLNTQELA